LSTQGTMRHIGARYVTKECEGVINFPLGSGAKPQPLTVFCFFLWQNETHFRTQKCELLEIHMNAHIQLVYSSQVSVDWLYSV